MSPLKSISFKILFLFVLGISHPAKAQLYAPARFLVKALNKTDDVTRITVRRAMVAERKLIPYGEDLIVTIPKSRYSYGYGYFKYKKDIEPFFTANRLNLTNDELELIQNMHAQEFLNSKGYQLEVDGIFGKNSKKALSEYHTLIKNAGLDEYYEFTRNIPFELRSQWLKWPNKTPGLSAESRRTIHELQRELSPYNTAKTKQEEQLLKKAGLVEEDLKLNKVELQRELEELENLLALQKREYRIRTDEENANPRMLMRKEDFYDYMNTGLQNIDTKFTPAFCFSNTGIRVLVSGTNGSSISINCFGETQLSYEINNQLSRSISYSKADQSTDNCEVNWEVCIGIEDRVPKLDAAIDACGFSASSNLTSLSATMSMDGKTVTLFSY